MILFEHVIGYKVNYSLLYCRIGAFRQGLILNVILIDKLMLLRGRSIQPFDDVPIPRATAALGIFVATHFVFTAVTRE
jgi:hypothetical protein